MIDKGDITTKLPNIKNILKGNYRYLYSSKFENLQETNSEKNPTY